VEGERKAEDSCEYEATATGVDLDQFTVCLRKKIMSRPELVAPPEIVGWLHVLLISITDLIHPIQYYGDTESKKYTNK